MLALERPDWSSRGFGASLLQCAPASATLRHFDVDMWSWSFSHRLGTPGPPTSLGYELDITRHRYQTRSAEHLASSNSRFDSGPWFSMARLSQGTAVAGASTSMPADIAVAELTQLLSRLQQNLLHPTPERERRLRTSEYERAKAEAVGQHGTQP
jgi:hypothetical protein